MLQLFDGGEEHNNTWPGAVQLDNYFTITALLPTTTEECAASKVPETELDISLLLTNEDVITFFFFSLLGVIKVSYWWSRSAVIANLTFDLDLLSSLGLLQCLTPCILCWPRLTAVSGLRQSS